MPDEERYSNRQVERLFDQQTLELKEMFKTELAPVLVQTTKTNGRVTKLEDRAAVVDRKMERFTAYMVVAGIIVSAAWALFLALVASGNTPHL